MLVTEYMEGGNLARSLRAKKISWWRKGRKASGHAAFHSPPAAALENS